MHLQSTMEWSLGSDKHRKAHTNTLWYRRQLTRCDCSGSGGCINHLGFIQSHAPPVNAVKWRASNAIALLATQSMRCHAASLACVVHFHGKCAVRCEHNVEVRRGRLLLSGRRGAFSLLPLCQQRHHASQSRWLQELCHVCRTPLCRSVLALALGPRLIWCTGIAGCQALGAGLELEEEAIEASQGFMDTKVGLKVGRRARGRARDRCETRGGWMDGPSVGGSTYHDAHSTRSNMVSQLLAPLADNTLRRHNQRGC